MTKQRINYKVVINGRTFKARHDEVIKVSKIDDATNWFAPRKLSDVYGRYSEKKEHAYNDWHSWFCKYAVNGSSIHIGSHNYNCFTLVIVVRDAETNEWWRCVATAHNNYATRIEIVD